MLIGGGGERKTLRIVAEHADIWHGFGSARDDRPQARGARRVVRAGSGATPPRSSGRPGCHPRPGRLPEDVADYAAGAEALYAVGTRLFTVGLSGPRYDRGPVRDLVAWRDAHAR